MRVDDVSGTDAHVADLLALYHLDALDRRHGEQVGRHLESCRQCRAAATEVCQVLAALALLGDDKDQLLNLYGALGTAVPPAFPARFAPQEPADPPHRDARETDRRRFRLRRGGARPGTATGEAPAAAEPGVGRGKPAPQRVEPSPAPPPPAPPPVAPPRLVPPPALSLPAAPPPPATPSPAAPPPAPATPSPAASVSPPAALAHRTPQRAAPPAVPGSQPAVPRPVAHPTRPDLDRSPESRRSDGGRRAESAPKRLLPRRAVAFAGLSALLAGTLTVAGISAKALLTPPGPEVRTATVRTAAASAMDQDSGTKLSVFVTQEGDRVTVRATLSGLDEGAGYRLYGYTFDGRQRPLVNWTGRAGVQELDGELPVGIADLSHFAVTRGARVVVTAYLPRDAGTVATTGS
ncbi:zf-HC2 domain-containing protein [Micromonospora sp. WMMD1219]|uniref:zf-HC2 domain-containing protein n=1 Tax=Micromonospora sp. WMMD1219 TaxID=3404115 RepID=UPI003BF4A0DD